MEEIKLERSLERWADVEPSVIASGAEDAIQEFIEDAQKDSAALASVIEADKARIAELEEASEAFASRVPWDNEPDEEAARAALGESQ